MLITIIILSVLLTISICLLIACYFIINVNLEKIDTYENWITDSNANIEKIKSDLIKTHQRLKDVDHKGIFQKDDDVGFVFSEILNIIEKIKDNVQK
jgi:hypothetical protein